MGLLTDIYNTVAKFFKPQEELDGDASKSVATNRLKLVLMQDRTNLTPKVLEQMRGELVDLLSKYLEMDKELLELNFEQEGDQVALMLSIPVIRAKDEDEIEAALNSENESEEGEEDYGDEEDCEEGEESECDGDSNENESDESTDEEPVKKPRKRRKKQVAAPEELENSEQQDEAEQAAETVSEGY